MIEAHGLCMRYGTTTALDNVSFSVSKGEIVGLLGPNGAGKSTAMKILATHIMPVSGTAKIGSFNVTEEPMKVRELLGYLPENAPLYPEMEVAEYLDFVSDARRLTRSAKKDRVEWVLTNCGIRHVYYRPLGELSKGYQQRVGLAQALIHDPAVLILDEPTSGLDPVHIIGIRKLIRELARTKTIIFSTHILSEAASVSDKLVIIDRGRIVGKGTQGELAQSLQSSTSIRLTVKAPSATVKKSLAEVAKIKHIDVTHEENGCVGLVVTGDGKESLWEDISAVARSNNWNIKELSEHALSLEEVFLSVVEKERVEK